MRTGIVLLALLLSPVTGVACEWPIVAVGSGIVSKASKQDWRELEHLLGTQVDHAVCGRMQRIRLYTSGFTVKRGFFVLTKDEALFVRDGKTKEVLFRTPFTWVRHASRSIFGATRFLTVTLDDAEFRFELACEAVAGTAIDEFERRTPAKTFAVPRGSGPLYSCN